MDQRDDVLCLCGKLVDSVGVEVVRHLLTVAAELNPATRALVARPACPKCGSDDVPTRSGYTKTVKHGTRRHRECRGCGHLFSTLSVGEGEVVEVVAVVGAVGQKGR